MIAPAYSQLDMHEAQAANPGANIFEIQEDGSDLITDNYDEGLHNGQQHLLKGGGDITDASVAVSLPLSAPLLVCLLLPLWFHSCLVTAARLRRQPNAEGGSC